MASSNSQMDKPQCGHPKRAELPDVHVKRVKVGLGLDLGLELENCLSPLPSLI